MIIIPFVYHLSATVFTLFKKIYKKINKRLYIYIYFVFYSNLEGGMCDTLLWLRNSVVGQNNDNLMGGGGGGG